MTTDKSTVLMAEGICRNPLATRPILYTDTIKGEQVCRDDLWALTTEELNNLMPKVIPASEGRAEQPGRIPELEGARISAEYWLNSARDIPTLTEAGITYEQAINAWKNAAYAMADKWYAARSAIGQTDNITEGTVEQDAARFRFLTRTITGELKHIGSVFRRWRWDTIHQEKHFPEAIDAAMHPVAERTDTTHGDSSK